MPSRRDTLLSGLDTRLLVGVEVGPLDKPLVRKDEGTVFYVDHCDTEALKARWSSDDNVDTSILHVDAVWGQNSLREALVAAGIDSTRGADYVLASHVLEHVPDLIGWLREVRDVVGPAGSLRLAIPDRRYSFDYLRRTTTLGEVVDAFVRQRRVPSASRVLDFALNMVHVDCSAAWRGDIDPSTLVHGYQPRDAIVLARQAEEGVYHDVHCWVFTPRSFTTLMAELARCDLLDLSCEWLVPTERDSLEFFVSMRPATSSSAAATSWLAATERLPRGRPDPNECAVHGCQHAGRCCDVEGT